MSTIALQRTLAVPASQPSQLSLLDEPELSSVRAQIVNVASVPQRSLFRYPGGKTWLVPGVRRWLGSRPHTPTRLVEPFVGGGIIGLTAVSEGLANRVSMAELDDHVAAVWEAVLGDGGETLASRILEFDVTLENVRQELERRDLTSDDRAFQTILRNRVQRGGILAPGAGLIKEGEAGKGLRSRWYPETLARRIKDIVAVKDKIDFIHGDGLALMRRYADQPDVVFFVDPPYTAGGGKRAGSRLYTHTNLDHEELFHVAASVKGDVLLTYDNDPDVVDLAEAHGFEMERVAMKNTHHAPMTELLIGRDLSWARRDP